MKTQEAGKLLVQRLHQLQDRRWMIPVLEKAISQMSCSPVAVNDYKIHFSKVHPESRLSVFMETSIKNHSHGRLFKLQLSCLFLPTLEVSGKLDVQFSLLEKEKLDSIGFHHYETHLSDPALILQLFPFDSELKGLVPATDPNTMKRVFLELFPNVNRLSYDVLNYKPGNSCTLHYTLLERGKMSSYQAYGKLYPDRDVQQSYLSLEKSWELSCNSDGLWRAARPLKLMPEWSLILQDRVPGRQLRGIFSDWVNNSKNEVDFSELKKYLHGIVLALRSIQTSGFTIGPYRGFDSLFSEQEKNAVLLKNCFPKLGEEISVLRQEILELEPRIPQSPLGYCHGDFAYWNILINEERGGEIGIIDFDRAGQAEMAYDAAYFLNHLCSLAYRNTDRFYQYMNLYHYFRQRYLQSAHEVSPERLAFYESLELSSFVLRSFRKNRHPSLWLEWAENLIQFARSSLKKVEGDRNWK